MWLSLGLQAKHTGGAPIHIPNLPKNSQKEQKGDLVEVKRLLDAKSDPNSADAVPWGYRTGLGRRCGLSQPFLKDA